MLKSLFTSGSRVEILEELLFNPQREFYLSDLARGTTTAPIQASKELGNLEKLGLINKKKIGKMTFYSINKEAPIYPDIRNIFLKTDSLGNSLKDYLKFHKLEHAIIFGSFAKGEEKPESDIDLLLIGEINEREIIKTIHSAERSLRREINYILWSEEEFQKKAGKMHHLLKDIYNNEIINIIGDENEFKNTIRKGLDKQS